MKWLVSIIAILLSFCCFAQTAVMDSLYKKLNKEKTDTGKAIILYNLSYYYQKYKPDSALLLGQQAYILSKKHAFLKGESGALSTMANAFQVLDNYPRAIEYYIEELKIEEKRNLPENISGVYINMSAVYNSEHDVDKALYYILQADSIMKQYHLTELALYTDLNIGDIYEKADQLDSALYYTQRCYALSLQQKNDLITGITLNNLGNIYVKKKKFAEALTSYQNSIPYLLKMQDENTLAECKLGMAKVYQSTNRNDSAKYYTKQVFDLALKNQFQTRAFDASALLVQLFKEENKIDSAFIYEEIKTSLKDSIDNKEKIRELQNITIAEQLRQKELAEARRQETEDRKYKLQLLSIGIMIPVLFFISVFLSRKKVHKKVIEFSGIVSLLMLFEYILLLIHPLIASETDHSPFLEIIIFVAIASLLTPAHHRIEEWLIHRLSKIHEHQLQKHLQVTMKDTTGKNL